MDVAVGQTTERSLTVTAEQLRQYTEISGDHNPLHLDEECVAKTLFRGLMAHGGITTGLLHGSLQWTCLGPKPYLWTSIRDLRTPSTLTIRSARSPPWSVFTNVTQLPGSRS